MSVEGPYETYEGSPISRGIFQFDMWGVTPTEMWDWEKLRTKIKQSDLTLYYSNKQHDDRRENVVL